jgi:hypothetical protein
VGRLSLRCLGSTVALIALTVTLHAPPSAAQACPCPKYDLAAIVKQADVIFVGKVLSATGDSTGDMRKKDGTGLSGVEYQRRFMLDVSTILKGAPPRFVEVATPTGPCGFMFAVGNTYLVTGTGDGRGTPMVTDICRGNVKGDAIENRAALIRDMLHPPKQR